MTAILSALKRLWIPLVVSLTVATSGFTVYRLHGIFGAAGFSAISNGHADEIVPFNPKQVRYEVVGPPGTTGSISYLDENAAPQQARFTMLPWTHMFTTTIPAVFANLVAQGDSNAIGCRISVNGEIKEQQYATEVNAQTFCLVKSA
ncbi:MmpS family transport accessory protein [Mycobacterium kansasii]